MTRIIALSGGRNAVGKTHLAVELAAHLAASGQRVCLLELVTGASAASSLLDVEVATSLSDRLSGQHAGERLPVTVPQGFDLVVGGHGGDWLRNLSGEQLATVSDALLGLDDYDFILVEVGISTDQNQLAFSLASPELLLVITPEPESRADAYAVLKLLYAEQYAGRISVLVNRSPNPAAGHQAYGNFREIAEFYLDMQLPLAGLVGVTKTAALPGGGANAPAADMHALTTYVLSPGDTVRERDMAFFCKQLLQAAGAVPAGDIAPDFKPVFAARRHEPGLQEQLALLAGQIDELIDEVERLRRNETANGVTAPAPVARPAGSDPGRGYAASIAAIANRSEQVTVGGETFAIYHMRTAGGGQQRFACQGIDDDLEEPEPQTRSS